MDQYLSIPFLGGWTSINPSYFDVNYRGTIGFDTLPYQYPKMPCQFQSVPPRLRHIEKILKGRRHVWTLRPSPDEGITSCFGRKIWLWLGKNVQMLRKGQSGWYLRLAKRFPSVGGPILRCVPGPTSPPCRNIQVHRLEAIGRHRFVRGWSIHTGNLGPNQPSSKAAIPLLHQISIQCQPHQLLPLLRWLTYHRSPSITKLNWLNSLYFGVVLPKSIVASLFLTSSYTQMSIPAVHQLLKAQLQTPMMEPFLAEVEHLCLVGWASKMGNVSPPNIGIEQTVFTSD